MSGESRRGFPRMSKDSAERTFTKSESRVGPNSFGTIVHALWPVKPALNLAQRINTTERAARLYIAGERKISARCVQVIVDELFK